MRQVRWSGLATRDLEKIDTYLSDLHPDLADILNDAVASACGFLLDRSDAGPVVFDHARKWRVPNGEYLLIYRISRAGITIMRVRHGRENWQPG